jgi:DNA-binding HxlR family transcriptional regulator
MGSVPTRPVERVRARVQGYGQFCPMAKAAEILCERWSLLVIRELIAGSRRFNELRRGVPLMSPSLLSLRLKQLEAAGVVARTNDAGGVRYDLTPAGAELQPVVGQLAEWGSKWVRRRVGRDDLDAGLLMWDIRRTVDPGRFPADRRVVVHFEFRDAHAGKRSWWLVSQRAGVDLCLEDPGYDVDVEVKAPLHVMTAVWMRDVPFREAARSLGLKVSGERELCRQLPEWLGASALAHAPVATRGRRAATKQASAGP